MNNFQELTPVECTARYIEDPTVLIFHNGNKVVKGWALSCIEKIHKFLSIDENGNVHISTDCKEDIYIQR